MRTAPKGTPGHHLRHFPAAAEPLLDEAGALGAGLGRGFMADVFISYSQGAPEPTQARAADLAKQRYAVWLDSRMLPMEWGRHHPLAPRRRRRGAAGAVHPRSGRSEAEKRWVLWAPRATRPCAQFRNRSPVLATTVPGSIHPE